MTVTKAFLGRQTCVCYLNVFSKNTTKAQALFWISGICKLA